MLDPVSNLKFKLKGGGDEGSIAQWLAYLIPSIPQTISDEKLVDVAEVVQLHCLEESGQWLENVDQMHVVLASGKLPKKIKLRIFWAYFYPHCRQKLLQIDFDCQSGDAQKFERTKIGIVKIGSLERNLNNFFEKGQPDATLEFF